MSHWIPGLERLQQQVAHDLSLLGKVTLETPCATFRKITVQHPAGTTLRVIVGVEFPVSRETYFVSVLSLVDPGNPKVIYSQNQTLRGLSADAPDLGPLREIARVSLKLALEKQLCLTGDRDVCSRSDSASASRSEAKRS